MGIINYLEFGRNRGDGRGGGGGGGGGGGRRGGGGGEEAVGLEPVLVMVEG